MLPKFNLCEISHVIWKKIFTLSLIKYMHHHIFDELLNSMVVVGEGGGT